jgi:hypothetical protein
VALVPIIVLLAGCQQRPSSSLAGIIPSELKHDLSGTVRSAGAPVTDAEVIFTAGRHATTVTSADRSGFFRIAGLDAGTVVLTVSAPGFLASTQQVLVVQDVVLDVDLEPALQPIGR